MFICNLMALVMLFGLVVSSPRVSVAKAPVIYERLQSAARARIGKRGLYMASVTRLSNGNLLACAHYGSSHMQRLSLWRSSDLGGSWKRIQNKGDLLFGSGATLKTLKDGSVLLHTGGLYRSEDGGVTWKIIDVADVGMTRSIVEQVDGKILLFGSKNSWYSGWEPPPVSLLGFQKDWYREGAQGSVAIHAAWRLSSNDGPNCNHCFEKLVPSLLILHTFLR